MQNRAFVNTLIKKLLTPICILLGIMIYPAESVYAHDGTGALVLVGGCWLLFTPVSFIIKHLIGKRWAVVASNGPDKKLFGLTVCELLGYAFLAFYFINATSPGKLGKFISSALFLSFALHVGYIYKAWRDGSGSGARYASLCIAVTSPVALLLGPYLVISLAAIVQNY